MKEIYPEIIVSDFVTTRDSFGDYNPYVIYFVFSPQGNFVVKGMYQRVQEYVNLNFPRCFFHYTMWNDGYHRGSWNSPKGLKLHFSPSSYYVHTDFGRVKKYDRSKTVIQGMTRFGYETFMVVRRVPHRWIEPFNRVLAAHQYGHKGIIVDSSKKLITRAKYVLKNANGHLLLEKDFYTKHIALAAIDYLATLVPDVARVDLKLSKEQKQQLEAFAERKNKEALIPYHNLD